MSPVQLCSLVRSLVCRFTHDAALWACLAALSMAAGELATAEVAFAALDAVDKLQYVLHLKGLQAGGAGAAAGAAAGGGGGHDPLVASELALYAGQTDEAEATLLQVCGWGVWWLFFLLLLLTELQVCAAALGLRGCKPARLPCCNLHSCCCDAETF